MMLIFIKLCLENSVSWSLPSAMECNLLSSMDGAMVFHKCSGGASSSTSISALAFICLYYGFEMFIVLLICRLNNHVVNLLIHQTKDSTACVWLCTNH